MFQTAEPASDYFATANYNDINLAELSAVKICEKNTERFIHLNY